MPDATPDATPDAAHRPDHTPHRDLPPPGQGSSEPIERFAAALDAVVLGTPTPGIDDASFARLVRTAARIQQRDGVWMTPNGPRSATALGEARKHHIWEDLMSYYPASPTSTTAHVRQPATLGRLGALMQPWVTVDDERPARRRRVSGGPLRFIPDLQPMTTFALVIAVLIGIGTVFSSIVDPGNPGVTPTASAEGLAGTTGQASPEAAPSAVPPTAAAPAAVPTADPGDEFQRPIPVDEGTCPFEPRPLDEIAAFLRDPGPVTPRAYLPATAPDPAVAEEVARTARTYLACEYGGPVNIDRALQTPRFIYENPANAYFREAGGAPDIATPEEREQLVTLTLGEDYRSNLFLVTDLAISRDEYEAAGLGAPPNVPPAPAGTPEVDLPNQHDWTFLPEQAIQLADGRIAVPVIYLVDPADVEAQLPDNTTDPVFVDIYIFAPDPTRGGQWGLDEQLPVCLGNGLCDDFYDATDPNGDALFPAPATPSATPDIATAPAMATPRVAAAARIPLGRSR